MFRNTLKCNQSNPKSREGYLMMKSWSLMWINVLVLFADAAVIDVVWRHVICACEAPVKKSRSSQSHSESGSPDSEQSGVFIIHYMAKSQKTHKMRCKNIRLEARQGRAGEWITKIEEKCKEGAAFQSLSASVALENKSVKNAFCDAVHAQSKMCLNFE